jgi:hypothetical protein
MLDGACTTASWRDRSRFSTTSMARRSFASSTPHRDKCKAVFSFARAFRSPGFSMPAVSPSSHRAIFVNIRASLSRAPRVPFRRRATDLTGYRAGSGKRRGVPAAVGRQRRRGPPISGAAEGVIGAGSLACPDHRGRKVAFSLNARGRTSFPKLSSPRPLDGVFSCQPHVSSAVYPLGSLSKGTHGRDTCAFPPKGKAMPPARGGNCRSKRSGREGLAGARRRI